MATIVLPQEEYNSLKQELILLREQELLNKINSLIDLMFESKYGFYFGDYTDDLTEVSINSVSEWQYSSEVWNEV